MKEKIKYTIIIISIFYMIIISVLTINTLQNASTTITIRLKDFSNEFTKLREKNNNIKNIECKNSIDKIINKSEKYVIKNKLDIKDLYKNGSLIPEYAEIIKTCNLKDNDKEKLSPYVLNSVLIYEEIIQSSMYNYELSLKDTESRLIGETSIIHSKLNSNKYLEIELINKIIDVEVQNEE